MSFSEKLLGLAQTVQAEVFAHFAAIDETAKINTKRVLDAFAAHRLSDSHFAGTTGYGYDDAGREVLERVFADLMGTEDALVRLQFVNGTHAIACALFGALSPGQTLVSALGAPYDTLLHTVGRDEHEPGSLRQLGVSYAEIPVLPDGGPDEAAIFAAVRDPQVGAVLIQRSRGYSQRPALSMEQIARLTDGIKRANPSAAVVVDNCYGEFVEVREPGHVGADLIAGSLIKNPGGGLALSGGYIAGRRELVEKAAARLTAPGIGGACGATLGQNRTLFQGLFLAPHVTAQALKTAVFCAGMLEKLGYSVSPAASAPRYDIIQTVSFGAPAPLLRFCRGIQKGAPVDSFATPEPWAMPGYDDPVIMAAGAFVQGASIELSCDAPMRPPYTAYLQGGLTFEAGFWGILTACQAILEDEA